MLRFALDLFLEKLQERYPKWDFIPVVARKYVWVWKKEKARPENETLYCLISVSRGDIYRAAGDSIKAKEPSGDIWQVINEEDWSFCKEEGISYEHT